ncbi:MAG TPA: carboxypeptidase-like regulatory domain-containing protein, partial [Gemmatimonadales bacterium]|nr:carboxypeptidase-like regulatory domain-containing protein [Gemmatimonadales bacterium]
MPLTRSRRLVALAFLAVCTILITGAVPLTLHAQSQASTGVLRGVVSDSMGGPLAGATVTLRNTATNLTRSLTTNGAG